MSYASEVLADSPVAYYRLGEASGTTMVDSSGNGRNGTYTGAPTLGATSLLVGDANTAATFNGTSYGEAGSESAWVIQATPTLEALIKPTAADLAGTHAIMDRDATALRAFQFRLDAGKLQFVKIAGGVTTATSPTTLTAGQTYHVAATYDGTTIRLYVNGAQVASGAASGTLATTSTPLRVGVSMPGGSLRNYFFNGTLDEVAYYGTALSAARLAAHYAAATSAGTITGTLAATLPGPLS